MKKKFILFALITLTSVVFGKDKGGVDIKNCEVTKIEDKVQITFDIVYTDIPSDYEVVLSPMLYNHDGSQYQILKPVTVSSKKRNTLAKRSDTDLGYRIVVADKGTQTVKYQETIPFERWMQIVSVTVNQQTRGCCGQTNSPAIVALDKKLVYYDFQPHFSQVPLEYELTELEKYDLENPFLHPMETYPKRYDILLKEREKGTSTLIFKVGSDVIDVSLQKNKEVLESFRKALELIENDPNATLKHIMVAGYASPEGGLAFNTALAQRRAEAVKRYLQSYIKRPSEGLFELYNGREDWGGLREKVEKSTMTERDEVLTIIDSYTMEQEIRKVKIKQPGGGAAYKYMLENFYPDLRSAGYVQVFYEIDRRATIATAVTHPNGKTTWVDAESPKNKCVTSINKAIPLMVENKFDEALKILIEFKDDPRAFNNIGVCYMMTGKKDEANKYFTKAVENGDEDARQNLKQANWMKHL